MMRLLLFVATMGLAAMQPAAGAAQSVYGCSNLTSRTGANMVEGENGTFFRIEPELRMFHAFSDETVNDLAALSQALAAGGTTLVYVPLPTRSLSMPDLLPAIAADYGFDVSMARTVFLDMLDRLAAAGVNSPDLRPALKAGPNEEPSFYRTDYRMTAAGAKRAARALADAFGAVPGYEALAKGRFETRATGKVELRSGMRSALQQRCLIQLAPVQAEGFATTRLQAGVGNTDNQIFGSDAATATTAATTRGHVAIVGTEVDGEAGTNLAGFVAEASGLETIQYAVSGGGSFAAISSYLTSRTFQEERPAFLVWTNPVENNLAQFGDQPMRELIAAAANNCRAPLSLLSGRAGNAVVADLTVLNRGQPYTLLVDTDGAAATEARFDFRNVSGLVRSKTVVRNSTQVLTGRFFMPMSGLWPEGAQTVEVVLDVAFGANARVSACADQG